MDYLTVKEVADLKGCSVQYVQKMAKCGRIETVVETNAQNNRLQYKIPVSALPVELRERYYSGSGLRIEVVPDKAELLPAAVSLSKKQGKVIKIKRGIETFAADEREVIAFWCEILRDWRV